MYTVPETTIKRRSCAVYDWLRLLSLVSVPWFLYSAITLSNRSSMPARFWAAATPATPYLVVLLWIGATAQAVFIKRHVRQGLALVGLRVLTAAIALNVDREPSEGLWFFFLANGFLWFFGSSTGKRQVNEGVGMFVRQSERLSQVSIEDLEKDPKQSEDLNVSPTSPNAAAVALFSRGEELLRTGRRRETEESFARAEALAAAGRSREAEHAFLTAFREGSTRIRQMAADRLDEMGKVEEF